MQYDYGFRIYDARLGKFLSVDPLFKSFPWYTPYQFAGNKPINSIDLDGLEEANVHILGKYADGEVKLRVQALNTPNNSKTKLTFNYIGITNKSSIISNLDIIIPGINKQSVGSALSNSSTPSTNGSYDWSFNLSYEAIEITNTKIISSGNETLLSDSTYMSADTYDPKQVRGGTSVAGGFTSRDVTMRSKLEFKLTSNGEGGGGYLEGQGDQFISEFASPFLKEFTSELKELGLKNDVVSKVTFGLSGWLYQDKTAVQKVEKYLQSVFPNASIKSNLGTSIYLESRPINATEIYKDLPTLTDDE